MNDVVECVIEIPMGTKNKYEVDKKRNRIKLDRVLYSALSYPEEYGYIENTLSSDGDPLDILLISSYPTFPGCLVDARVLGYLKVIDNNLEDEKIIAVVDKDPRFKELNNLENIPNHQLVEIKDFFLNYKKLQNIDVKVTDFYSKEEALKLIEECKKRFNSL